jgi:hypothetical protein
MKKKGKVTKFFEDYGVFILIESYELRTITGDALGELVKCKSPKTISKLKFPVQPDISGVLTRLQRHLPDMSRQPGHVQSSPYPQVNCA